MRRLRGWEETVAVHGRRRMGVWLLGALLALSLAAPVSASAAGVTFAAPPGARSYPDQSEGPAGYTEAPLAIRTTDTRPAITIQADGGTQLQCHFDDVFTTQTCGGPGPGCAAVCGSFEPAAPLGPDSDPFSPGHFLAVDLMDADGNAVASVWVNIDVDTTAPVIRLASSGGVLTNGTPGGNGIEPLRPNFDFQVTDSNSVGGDVDTISCAWGPATSSPAFTPCGRSTGSIGSRSFDPRLPYRHRLYRLQVRATDDFGRSTTAAGVYDPMPCLLSVRRPARLGSLLSSGIATTVRCDTSKRLEVAAFAFMVDGDRSGSPRHAVSENPILGEYQIAKAAPTFTVSRRFRLSHAARASLAHAHVLGLVLAAGTPDKIGSGTADDSLSYQAFTLRR
jgi:hypothetical protein